MGRLTGRLAVVTGGGSGIGCAASKLFAAEGARVAVLDRNGDSARETVRQIHASAGDARDWTVDLSEVETIDATIAKVADAMGKIDILMNNAATHIPSDVDSMTYPDWLRVLNTNLTASFLCARAAARSMRRNRWGSIVNVSSAHRMISEAKVAAYAASKAGVAQLTRNLAIEFAPDNIVANSISPGFIQTPMADVASQHFNTNYLQTGRIALRRAGQPEEIAAAALFLAARECGYMTGADMVVDGGLTITL